ncbi:hypothetical protein NUW58_g2654 [Xylaria curta]|uniref:Uncharacterized protein n=1 Tax=Xylaria curta TaxID=42375 RepID=A0ACC1PFG8_9PEZI|nr:hypothetical protein NUW58_g2654 [Xylaria curta]
MTTPKDPWREARNSPAESVGLSFQDKAVLVIGANLGLGTSPLMLAVRLREKSKAASFYSVEPYSVNVFADQLDEKVAKLDVALLCAGIAVPDYRMSADGCEFAT